MKLKPHKVQTTVSIRMNPSAPWWVYRGSARFLYTVGGIILLAAVARLTQTRYGDALTYFIEGWALVSLGWFWGLVEQRTRRSFVVDLSVEPK